jgi:uncharacterized protein
MAMAAGGKLLSTRIEDLEQAADDGNAEAQFLLGVCYATGRGVARNDTTAARWFHQASKLDHVGARASLGFLYSRGRGVRRDPVLGYLFVAQAAQQGDLGAADLMKRMRRRLTPVQLKDAERRLRDSAV